MWLPPHIYYEFISVISQIIFTVDQNRTHGSWHGTRFVYPLLFVIITLSAYLGVGKYQPVRIEEQ